MSFRYCWPNHFSYFQDMSRNRMSSIYTCIQQCMCPCDLYTHACDIYDWKQTQIWLVFHFVPGWDSYPMRMWAPPCVLFSLSYINICVCLFVTFALLLSYVFVHMSNEISMHSAPRIYIILNITCNLPSPSVICTSFLLWLITYACMLVHVLTGNTAVFPPLSPSSFPYYVWHRIFCSLLSRDQSTSHPLINSFYFPYYRPAAVNKLSPHPICLRPSPHKYDVVSRQTRSRPHMSIS